MSDMDLKLCPFCGGLPHAHRNYSAGGIGQDGYLVQCDNCEADGPFDLGESGCIETWNTRPIEDALQREVARLTAELVEAKDWADKQGCEAVHVRYLLEKLTPGGSEFSTDPDRCVIWIRERLSMAGHLTAENARLTAENQALKSSCLDISAVVSERCGDDEGMAGEPNEDDDTPATYVVKSVFAILEKLDEVAPGWNYPAPPEGEA